jgi:hypothetical protein
LQESAAHLGPGKRGEGEEKESLVRSS